MKLHLEVLGPQGRGGGGGRVQVAGREPHKQILPKSYSNADMGKKETTNLNFCVPSLATPPIWERRRQLIKQLRGLGNCSGQALAWRLH